MTLRPVGEYLPTWAWPPDAYGRQFHKDGPQPRVITTGEGWRIGTEHWFINRHGDAEAELTFTSETRYSCQAAAQRALDAQSGVAEK